MPLQDELPTDKGEVTRRSRRWFGEPTRQQLEVTAAAYSAVTGRQTTPAMRNLIALVCRAHGDGAADALALAFEDNGRDPRDLLLKILWATRDDPPLIKALERPRSAEIERARLPRADANNGRHLELLEDGKFAVAVDQVIDDDD